MNKKVKGSLMNENSDTQWLSILQTYLIEINQETMHFFKDFCLQKNDQSAHGIKELQGFFAGLEHKWNKVITQQSLTAHKTEFQQWLAAIITANQQTVEMWRTLYAEKKAPNTESALYALWFKAYQQQFAHAMQPHFKQHCDDFIKLFF